MPSPSRIVESRLASALIVALAVIAAYGWSLGEPFRADDALEILRAPERLSFAPPAEGPDVIIFRPVLWAVFGLERAVFSEPLTSAPFHATSLLLHLFCAWMVLALGRRWLGSGPALFAASFFAVHPGGGQAVTWIAARGDLLATLFGGLALLVAFPRDPHATARRALGSGVLLGLALGSKIAAITFPPLLVLLVLADRSRGSIVRRLVHAGLLLLPPAALYLWRWWWLGTPALTYYDGPAQEIPPDVLLRDLPRLIGRLLVPWNETPFAEGRQAFGARALGALGLPGQTVAAGAMAAAIVFGWMAVPRRTARHLAAALIAFGLVCAPALYLLSRAWALPQEFPSNREMSPDANAMNRALYPAMVAAAWLVGAGLGRWRTVSKPWRGVLLGVGIVVALITVDAAVHHARMERAAGRCVARRLDAVEDALREREGAVHVALIDWHVWRAGHPLLGAGLVDLFRPPFRSEAASVSLVRDRPRLEKSRVLDEVRLPIAFRRLDAAGEVVEAADIPGLVDALPEMLPLPDAPQGALAWRPASEVPLRQVGALRLPLARAGKDFGVTVGNEAFSAWFDVDASGAPVTRWIDTEPSLDWKLAGALRRVSLPANVALTGPPQLEPALPPLMIHAPEAGGRVSVKEPFEAVIGAPPNAGPVVVTLRGRFGRNRILMEWTVPPERLGPPEAGRHRLTLTRDMLTEASPPELSWAQLPTFFRLVLAPRDIHGLDLEWRVRATSPRKTNTEARTPWRKLTLVP